MKKLFFTILIIIIFIQNIYSSNLALLSLEDASDKELSLMCSLRDIDCDQTRDKKIEELKKLLIEENLGNSLSYNFNDQTLKNESKIVFKIISSDSLKKIGNENSLFILEGNVDLSFKDQNDSKRELLADIIIIDGVSSKVAALGNVKFINSDTSDNLLNQDVEGSIITLDLQTNNITVSNGSIYTKRKNSDNEYVVFNATSSLLTLNTVNNSLILKNGFITTNPESAYSSISAEKLALLNHGDLYLENAVISIGRVKVFYLPFFFSPGAQMLGNPSLGYESNRGLFVNTTFEILGKYPSFAKTETNSFNSLLKSENNSDKYVNGSIYNSSENASLLQKWASKTKSYIALFLDTYEKTPYSISDLKNGSIVLGYDSQFNLINNSLIIESKAITSLASDGIKGDILNYSDYPIFRYDTQLDATYKFKEGLINVKVPIVSDPLVRKTYSNRLSTFNLDALWNNNQAFPSTYNSDVTKYSWNLDSKFDIKADSFSPYVEEIKVNKFDAKIDYEWEKIDGKYLYVVKEMTLPKLELNISGELLNLSDNNQENNDKDINNSKYNLDTKNDVDPLLIKELYNSSYEEVVKLKKDSLFNISYLFKNTFYNTVSEENDSNNEIYNNSQLTFNTKIQVEPNIINMNNATYLIYIYDDDKIDTKSNSIELITHNIINLSYFNLYYYFDSKLFKYSKSEESNDIKIEKNNFKFTDDFITKHEIEWKQTFSPNFINITPSLKFVLPPLNLAFKPSLKISYNNFENNTIFTYDIDSSNFELSNIDNILKYSINNFYFNFATSFDVINNQASSRFLDSLIIKLSMIYSNKEANQYASFTNKYYGLYDSTIKNYFSEFLFTYKNSYIVSKFNLKTQDNILKPDYFINTISLSQYTKYWWLNRIGLKLNIDATFNYSFSDKYSTYFSLDGSLSFRIAEFMLMNLSIKTSNYGFYRYYDSNDNFNFIAMIDDLFNSFDIFGNKKYSTQFNLEKISLDFIHMMDDWDLHCKYSGSVVLSNYNYQWVPSVSIFLQWKTLPELKVDQSFSRDDEGWNYNS